VVEPVTGLLLGHQRSVLSPAWEKKAPQPLLKVVGVQRKGLTAVKLGSQIFLVPNISDYLKEKKHQKE
jgi:hypothetical protein